MVKSLIQALCLVAAASTAIAMPYDYDGTPALTTQDKTEWPFSELIRESPFEYHRQAAAMAAGVASRTRPPCGHGGSLLGGSNSSFFISVVNDNDAFEYSGNTYLGWVNQPIYSPWNCQQACKALNATGTKCNSYNTCECPCCPWICHAVTETPRPPHTPKLVSRKSWTRKADIVLQTTCAPRPSLPEPTRRAPTRHP